jgi:porin
VVPPRTCRLALSAHVAGAALAALAIAGPALLLMAREAGAQQRDPDPPLVQPALTYDGDIVDDVRGGRRRGATYIGNLHLRLTVEAPSGSLLEGTTGYADLLSIHGGQAGELVGDAQGVSNIAGPHGNVIEELWVQHNLGAGTLSLLAGIYDLNSEFYRLASASLFLDSAFGIGPELAQSGIAGPSIFPRTSAGVRVGWKPAATLVVRAAVLDGQPVMRPNGERGLFRAGDGWLGVFEAAWLSRAASSTVAQGDPRRRIGRFAALERAEDKLALGTWHYRARLPEIDVDAALPPAYRSSSSGAYLVGESRLVGRDAGAVRRLSGFFHLGGAAAATNRFSRHVAAGLVGSGWFSGRDADQLGLAVTSAIDGAPYRRRQSALGAPAHAAETALELSYFAQPAPWLTLQPDLQYVVHPNTERVLANAWVVQLRFEIAF